MWLVLPLIFLMSWRTCRRVGQAFNETAAWVVGYLVTAGVIILLDYGSNLVSATPDDPAAVVALLGGFVGMGVSRYLWKRRGGHREPKRSVLPADNPWVRAGRAMLGGDKPQKSSGAKRPAASSRPSSSTSARASAPPKQTASTSKSAEPATERPASSARPATNRRPAAKSGSNRWARALGAMLEEPKQSRPRKRG